MRPKELIKSLDKIVDFIQADIEDAKAKKDFQAFDVLMRALSLIKECKNNIYLLIKE